MKILNKKNFISDNPIKGEKKMTEYFVFRNEPNAIMHRIFANNKHDALKKYNDKMGTNYKFQRSHLVPLLVVTVRDWQHYNFRKISYAAQD